MTGKIKIMFHATFREVTGNKEIEEKLDKDRTVQFFLNKLQKTYGKDFNGVIDASTGKISTEVLVLINGRAIRKTDIVLKDNDVLLITLPLGGGWGEN
ncbi:MAG: MoaD family protein [Candidatus Heimdallarchaeota archaeon]|nr:MAG: MoaD family protein [Candidatus Heimdallarchaeota archaeon]